MGKLIDIDDIFGEKVIMVSQNAYDEVMKLMRMIREAPEVDAVPVVRCKDCKHAEFSEPGMTYCPGIVGSWVDDDWFCADGERREGDAVSVED